MDYYNRKIADKLLSDQIQMITHTEQPTMFNNELNSLDELHDTVYYGGAKPYQYVLPGDNVASFEPSSLSVGTNPFESRPNHLIEVSSQPHIVAAKRKRGRPKKVVAGGNIFDTIGNVTKTIAPLAIPLMMAAGLPKKKRGGNFLGTLKSIGKSVAPVASQIGNKVILPVGQQVASQALTNYLTSGAGLKKRGRPKGGNFLGTMKSIGRTVAPVAKQIGNKVVMPVVTDVAKQALTNYLTSGAGLKKRGRPKGGNFLGTMKSIGRTIAPVAKTIGNKVIMPVVTDVAKQALTNYLTKPSSGAGLKSKRSQLIKQVMSKHHLSLGAASKFIKEHNL
jgi:hypothetical protein